MLRRSSALFVHELRSLARDPFPFIVLIAMPTIVMAFVRPAFRVILHGEGFTSANGAELAVPGMAVMFSFFLVGNVGLLFFREYTWTTWERLRSTQVSLVEVVFGRCGPYLALALVQQTALFVIGGAAFGLHVDGPLWLLAPIAFALALCLVSCGVAAVAVFRTAQQVNAFQTLGTMAFAGLGGALTPAALLPGWARTVAPVTPTYWAIRAYQTVILTPANASDIVRPCAVLLVMTAIFTSIALARLRFEQRKVGWI